jgi:uncharacterized LabA/DUF88 family protein|tara:strand:+ start:366 stop:920 length:555 start_codon:yes stop_codon:yes gene_type:complete
MNQKRISVYIDGPNFHYGIKSIRPVYSDLHFDFEKFIKNITGKRKLVDVYYFNAPLKQQYNKKTYSKQQKMFDRLRSLGYHVILCKRKKRFKGEKETHIIKEDDILLALHVLKDAYEDKYETAILVSGDGDFASLPKFIKIKAKNMENYYFEKSVSNELIRSCFKSTVINKKTANKFFLRNKKH